MKKHHQKAMISFLLLTLCTGCGRQQLSDDRQPELTAQGLTANTPSDYSSIGIAPPTVTPDVSTDLSEQYDTADNDSEEIIPDFGDTKDTLQFQNDDTLFINPSETLPLYAIEIRRDSTYQYLLQVGMEDVSILEYIDDSYIKTDSGISLQYRMPGYPEYDLYMEYSIRDAYWNFALIVR